MKIKLPAAFFPASAPLLGVDLGSSMLKVLELRVTRSGLAVAGFARRSLRGPDGALSEKERFDACAAALRELAGGRRFGPSTAAAALPGNLAVIRFFKPAPGSPPADQARALSPFDPEETAVDVRVEGEEAQALLARRPAVDGCAAALRGASLYPESVINDALALEDAYLYLRPGAVEETVVLVNAGASAAGVDVLERGVSRAVRVVHVAGDAFTAAVSAALGVSPQEAENFKLEYGLSGLDIAAQTEPSDGPGGEAARIYRETAARVAKALKPCVRDMCLEIRRTIESFQSRRGAGAAPVARVVLAGGTADMKRLAEFTAAETGLPVEVFRPLEGADLGRGAGDLDPRSAALAVACGLSLNAARRDGRKGPGLNLLPAAARRAGAARRLAPSPALAALAGFLVAASAGGLAVQRRLAEEREAAGFERLAEARRARASRKPSRRALAKAAPPGKGRKGRAPSPGAGFGYLSSLKASGALGQDRDAVVMLSGGRGGFVARAGRLFDADEKAVAGVTAEVRGGLLVLSAAGQERARIPLPR